MVLVAEHVPALPSLIEAFAVAVPRAGEDVELMQLLSGLAPVLKPLVDELNQQVETDEKTG